jgi:hypothetical protein
MGKAGTQSSRFLVRHEELSGHSQFRLTGGSKGPQRARVLWFLNRKAGQSEPRIHSSQEREFSTLEPL